MKIKLLFGCLIFSTFAHAQTKDTTTHKLDNSICQDISKDVDEFTGEITFKARISIDEGGDVSFIKIIKKGVTSYYLSIWIEETGIYTGTGVYLILKDGTKINKLDAKVKNDFVGGKFYTTTLIKLLASDIASLKKSGIEKFKLYISKGQITEYSDLSMDYFNCLLKIK